MTPEQFDLITTSDPTADGGRLVKTSAVIAPGGGTATAANQTLEITAINDVATNQTNGTQKTQITDGTDTLLINTDGSANTLIYGSDDGGATHRVIKTDAGGAIQVDLEVASVTVNNGAGASAVNIQDGGNSITVDGPLTDVQLRATAVPVSGTITVTPSGTQNVNVTQVAGVAIAQGHGVAATAIRVELPTDGTGVVGLNAGTAIIGKVGIDQTTPGTTNGVVVNSSALPTGASTSALQTTGNTTLTTISGKLPASLGAKTSAASLSIVPASDASFSISGTVTIDAVADNLALETGGNLDQVVAFTSSTSANVNSVLNQLTAGANAVAKAEDAASANADVGIPSLAVRKAIPANTSGTDGDYEFLQISAGRLWASTLVTDVVPGVAATNLGKAEDAAHASGDTGVMSLGVRNDARGTTFAGTNGDYSPIAVDSTGAAFVNGTSGTGAQTITSSVVTDDNTIAAGATSLGFTTSLDFTGNINGVARLASTFYGFESAIGRTLPAVTYTTTTGSITIDQIV